MAMKGLKVARRVGAAQGPVQQRLVDALVELAPALAVDAVDEEVGVEGGLADEGQHLAAARVQRHQRAAAVAEHLFHQGLQPDVHRQHQLVAGRGRAAVQAPHGAAGGAGFDFLVAGLAVQAAFVALLQAQLADVLGALVVALVGFVPVFHGLLLGQIDAADVAQQVAARLAQRVVAEQPRLDLDAREAEALRGETRHFLVGQPGADGQRIGTLELFAQALEAAPVARADLDQIGQLFDQGIQFGFAVPAAKRRGETSSV
jgi:hypothetical protein